MGRVEHANYILNYGLLGMYVRSVLREGPFSKAEKQQFAVKLSNFWILMLYGMAA